MRNKFLFSWGKTRQGWGKTRPMTVHKKLQVLEGNNLVIVLPANLEKN